MLVDMRERATTYEVSDNEKSLRKPSTLLSRRNRALGIEYFREGGSVFSQKKNIHQNNCDDPAGREMRKRKMRVKLTNPGRMKEEVSCETWDTRLCQLYPCLHGFQV